jgi:hypothetical protein
MGGAQELELEYGILKSKIINSNSMRSSHDEANFAYVKWDSEFAMSNAVNRDAYLSSSNCIFEGAVKKPSAGEAAS